MNGTRLNAVKLQKTSKKNRFEGKTDGSECKSNVSVEVKDRMYIVSGYTIHFLQRHTIDVG